MALTPEEQQELAALRAELAPKPEGTAIGAVGAAIDETISSATMGLSDQIIAVGSAAKDSISGKSFSESYNKNIEEIREDREVQRQVYPVSSTIGDVAGTVGSLVAGGLGVAKAGIKASTMFGKVALNAVTDASVIGVTQILKEGQSGQQLTQTMGDEYMVSLGIGSVLGPLGKVASKVARGGAGFVEREALKVSLDRVSKQSNSNIDKFVSEYGQDGLAFVKQGLKDAGIENPIIAKDPVMLQQNLLKLQDQIGQQVKSSYNKLNKINGEEVVDNGELFVNISNRLKQEIAKGGKRAEEAQKILMSAQKEFFTSAPMTGGATEVLGPMPIPRDLMQLWDFRTAFNSAESGLIPELSGQLRDDIGGLITNTIKQKVNSIGIEATAIQNAGNKEIIDIGKKLVDDLQINNRKYQMIADFNKKVINGPKVPQTNGGLFRDVLQSRMLRAVGLGGLAVSNPAAALGVAASAAALNVVKSQAESIAGQTSEALLRDSALKVATLVDTVQKYPADTFMRAIGTNVVKNIQDSEIDADKAFANINADFSAVSMYKYPIARDNESAKTRLSDIMGYASVHSPQLAQQIASMVDNQEDIGSVMDTLSKQPKLQKFFEAGLGWGGYVYTEADKRQVIEDISKYYDIPSITKLALVKDVIQTGKIPDLSQVEPRKPFVFTPRQRKKVEQR